MLCLNIVHYLLNLIEYLMILIITDIIMLVIIIIILEYTFNVVFKYSTLSVKFNRIFNDINNN